MEICVCVCVCAHARVYTTIHRRGHVKNIDTKLKTTLRTNFINFRGRLETPIADFVASCWDEKKNSVLSLF